MSICLGIELGSTRIKCIAIDDRFSTVSNGDYTWKSSYENGIWTYSLDEVLTGLRSALSQVAHQEDVKCMGISAMMHGYLAFDKDWNLLTPFRTWQNTCTGPAADELTRLFAFNIPQRWSVAHLYQAVLNGEPHLKDLAHITTLSGYVHYLLTGENVLGIGDASGMFPIDSTVFDYDAAMMAKFDELVAAKGYDFKIASLLPKVLTAGESAGTLTAEGARLLGCTIPVGTPFAPPEGDAGTGMVATNAVAPRTGNVSAGTSIFAMMVLEKALSKYYTEIDMVTTPAGMPTAMVHCNNCTNDMNAWVSLFGEVAALFGDSVDTGTLFTKLYEKSLEGDASCDGVTVVNYMAGEGITHLDEGRPLVVRTPGSHFTLANFLRASLYATLSTLKMGMDILEDEQVVIDRLMGHGGLFKTPVVGQKYMAAAFNAPVTVMETAGEGGPFGMALLASYLLNHKDDESLDQFLDTRVFSKAKSSTLKPDEADVAGFLAYMEEFKKALKAEAALFSKD